MMRFTIRFTIQILKVIYGYSAQRRWGASSLGFPSKILAANGISEGSETIKSGHRIFSSNTTKDLEKSKKSNMPVQTSQQITLKFVRLSDNAITPTRGSTKAAGFDLYSAYDYVAPPMSNILVKTDLQIAVPDGCYGRIAPRSGLALKNFIDVGAGVVDQDYRGNVGVVLFNFSRDEFKIKKGDRVAQLVCERIAYPDLEECDTLEDTSRGINGFGSTGKN